ncbi:hypothetical protein IE077_001219, partial [Cardiosporidium cionae]
QPTEELSPNRNTRNLSIRFSRGRSDSILLWRIFLISIVIFFFVILLVVLIPRSAQPPYGRFRNLSSSTPIKETAFIEFSPETIRRFFKLLTSIKRYFSVWQSTTSTPYFDYIIVGAGAAGCPAAYTFASAGFSVLLIERGMERTRQKTPLAMDIYGAGIVVDDPTVSQRVITTQGVHTHVASVMGGGT